jgi:hypothetical protein
MSTTFNPYCGFRYPAEIINQAVWLYLYCPQFLRHRIKAYAASAANGSFLCRMAFGV